MNILVVGNGFDLAHGLPTTYRDFLHFVQGYKEYKKSGNNRNGEYYTYFSSLSERICIEIDSLIDNNLWLSYFIGICDERYREGKKTWIDFESEISGIVQILDSARKTLYSFFDKGLETASIERRQYTALYNLLNSYCLQQGYKYGEYSKSSFVAQEKKLLSDLNRLIRCLEIYLSDYVSKIKCKPISSISRLNIDKVLSFNYTDTYKKVYGNKGSFIDYDHIHGKSKLKSNVDVCNLVLGIDEYLKGDAMNQDNEFVQFKKFYQRIFKGTGCHYVDWLGSINNIDRPKQGNSTQHNIYFYGHSLDVTDKDIIYKLIMADRFKSTIFYHSKEALGKLIANLVKVIGEEELIRRTDGNNRTIVFQPTSKEMNE